MSRRARSKRKKSKIGRREKISPKKQSQIERNTKKRNRRAKKDNKTIILVLSIIVIICIIIISTNLYEKYKTKKDYEEIRNVINHKTIIIDDEKTTRDQTRIEKIQELKKENEDIVGWLEILDTSISYPVLQGEDNLYYMTRNYKKQKSKEGSLFLDKDYDFNIPSSNLLIYGHNNKGSTEMFATLLEYKEESFYNNHKYIRFTTDKDDSEYEIISVFFSRVYNQHEKDVFRYYYFIDAENEKEFNNYIKSAKKASIYHINASAQYGDQLLTLSTCDYSQPDGRFVVVARKR